MKDFEQHIKPDHDNKQLSAEQRQVRTEKHMRSMAHYPGHTTFEFVVATGEITVAKIETTSIELAAVKPNRRQDMIISQTALEKPLSLTQTVPTVRKKIMERPGCLYCSALNKKNAYKRFMNMYKLLVQVGAIIQPKQN